MTVKSKRAAETKRVTLNFSDLLEVDDQLTGTPTAAEVQSADLTISSPEIGIPAGTVTPESYLRGSAYCPALSSREVSFLVSGGTAGTEYTVRVTVSTDKGQVLIRDVKLRVN